MSIYGWISLTIFFALIFLVIYYFLPRKKRDFKQLYIEALESLLRGEHDDAFLKLKEVVNTDSSNLSAYMKIGDILRENQKPHQALKIHQSLTASRKFTPSQKVDLYISMAKDLYNLHQFDKAEEKAETVLSMDKRNRWVLEFLVKLAEEKKMWEKALSHLKKLEKITGKSFPQKHAYYLLMQGKELENQDKLSDAHEKYAEAVELDENYPEPYLYLGKLCEKEGLPEQAIQHWIRYAELYKQADRAFYSKLEKALFNIGRYSEMEDIYSRIIEKNPDNLGAIIGLVNVLQAKGQIDRAMLLLDDVVMKDNKSVQARLARLKLSLQKINQKELSREVDKIATLIPDGNGSALSPSQKGFSDK